MSERHQIDSWVASHMCDAVESFTHLEETITDLRWRMLRGETLEMRNIMFNAKKHARELRSRLDGLGYALESGEPKAQEARELKIVQQEKTNG
jgi:hypothetical protein